MALSLTPLVSTDDLVDDWLSDTEDTLLKLEWLPWLVGSSGNGD